MIRYSLGRGLFSLVVCALLTMAAQAQTNPRIPWQTDYTVAHQTRISQHRPMLVYLTMDGCPYCHKMLATTYQNKAVASRVSKTFVPTVINGTHQEELASQFKVRVYPTTYIVDSENRIVDRIEGFVEPDEFQERLTASQERMARVQRREVQQRR